MDSRHISALEAKHAGLDARISTELKRPSPDTAILAVLKKRKLKIKEELIAL